MAEVTIKRSAADLHVGSADSVPSIGDLVDRIIAISGQTPTELVDTMATESGGTLARLTVVESQRVDPDRFLRSWDSIGRASPAALTGAQYQRFLQGDHPITGDSTVQPFDLYGADVPTGR